MICTIRRAVSALLLFTFFVQTCWCGDVPCHPHSPARTDNLAPKDIITKRSADVISDVILLKVLDTVASRILTTSRTSLSDIDEIKKTTQDQFRTNRPALKAWSQIKFDGIRRQNDTVVIPLLRKDKLYDVYITRRDHKLDVKAVEVKPEQPASAIPDEPLIGHGFKTQEIDSAEITTMWDKSKEFVETLRQIKRDVKTAPLPSNMRHLILNTMRTFMTAKDGRRMGIAPARYENNARYRMGGGTAKTIMLAPEYFDPGSPFYERRKEALLHEIIHAARNQKRSEDDVEGDFEGDDINTEAHLDAMRIGMLLYWEGLTYEEKEELRWAPSEILEHHMGNKLGALIRNWKNEQSKLPEVIARDNWSVLLGELQAIIHRLRGRPKKLLEFLKACDDYTENAGDNRKFPIESRWPILRAVALLSADEQKALINVLSKQDGELRKMPVVDSIRLLLNGEIPEDYLDQMCPELTGCTICLASSEIWYAGGGLGRVMQFLASALQRLLGEKYKDQLMTVEAGYSWRRNAKGDLVPMDYKSGKVLTHPIVTDIEEVDRFQIIMGDKKAEAVVRRGYNELGIAVYLISDKEGFYTHSLYNYNEGGNTTLPTLEQFTEFISKATLEFYRRHEEEKKLAGKGAWKAGILYVQDSQFSLVSTNMLEEGVYVDSDGSLKRYADSPIIEEGLPALTTHTYPDRNYAGGLAGERKMAAAHVPHSLWDMFKRRAENYEEVFDFTSGGLTATTRLWGWTGCVSDKQRRDVSVYDAWKGVDLIAVANGADSDWTAKVFKEIAAELAQSGRHNDLFPKGVFDYRHMTARQISLVRREAKKRFRLDPEQYFTSKAEDGGAVLNPDQDTVVYIGRLVDWKCGRLRALTDENITKLVERGVQVVIFGNVQNTEGSRKLAQDLEALVNRLEGKGPGKLIFVPRFDPPDQLAMLAASDVGVVDSNPRREAAGATETGFMSVGAVVLSPPWPGGEGILVAQGVRFVPGEEGNILVPDITIREEDLIYVSQRDNPLREAVEKAYFDKLASFLDLSVEDRAVHIEQSLRLDLVLNVILTAAEYLRQWNGAMERKKARLAEKKRARDAADAQPALAGSIKNGLEALIEMPEFFTTGVTFKEFAAARELKNKISESAYHQELLMLQRLNVVRKAYGGPTRRYIYVLRDEIRNLSPPDRDIILSQIAQMPELRRANIMPMLFDLHARIGDLLAKHYSVEGVMDMIHKIDMGLYPAVPDGKTLYKVIPLEFVPQSMRMKFYTMVTRLNKDHPELREKIIVTTGRQGLIDKINELLDKDPQGIVMAALPNEDDLARLPPGISGQRLRALVFKGEPGDLNSFKQVECILAALRALYRDDAGALRRLYKLTTGDDLSATDDEILAAINNPQELARRIIFNLKPIQVERREMRDRLNSHLLKLIYEAA